MSIRGTCFDNGMSGKCDMDCEEFVSGDCVAGNDVLDDFYEYLVDSGVLEEELLLFYNDVELWLLRGKGATDKELLYKAHGYEI